MAFLRDYKKTFSRIYWHQRVHAGTVKRIEYLLRCIEIKKGEMQLGEVIFGLTEDILDYGNILEC